MLTIWALHKSIILKIQLHPYLSERERKKAGLYNRIMEDIPDQSDTAKAKIQKLATVFIGLLLGHFQKIRDALVNFHY